MTVPLGVVAPGVHRLPAPPAASVRGRVTVAAVATGAVVAAGQSAASPLTERPDLPPVTLSALAPVAEVSTTSFAVDAIGGDQLLPRALTAVDLDPESQLDIQNLTKAVEIGQELARRDAILASALAFGAPQANLVGDRAFVQPTIGRFTSGFGARWGRSHNGIDIAGPIGTPIYAVTDGVVEQAGAASGFGLVVKIRHPDGTMSVYGHVNQMFVEVGDEVGAGEQIAEIGNRGQSTGPHLHFEIHDAGDSPLNPRPWLQEHGIDGW
ncbi:M23 family metallopeptidase [Pseudonocardia sp.]|uniref:M23 family metallopeptidase n=1 Tax=Pseudonocardia sp. TaxID=60912 RepID=UPI00262C6393|nr:M23 family metallopeptidase [Pseudonocardia sp.]